MKKRDEYIVKEIADEEGWKSIRNQLVKNTGLGAIPSSGSWNTAP